MLACAKSLMLCLVVSVGKGQGPRAHISFPSVGVTHGAQTRQALPPPLCPSYRNHSHTDDRGGGTAAKKGLSQSEVEMLPMQIGNGSGPVDQCCICMEDMTSTEPIIRLPACLHTFHRYLLHLL